MSTDEYRRNTDLKKLLCALLIGAICVCALTGCKRKAPAQDASEDDIPVAANAGAEVTPVPEEGSHGEEDQSKALEQLPTLAPVETVAGEDSPAANAGSDEYFSVDELIQKTDEFDTYQEPPKSEAQAGVEVIDPSTVQFSSLVDTTMGFTFNYPSAWQNVPGIYTVCYREVVEKGDFPARISITGKKLVHSPEGTVVTDELTAFVRTIYKQYDTNTFQLGTTNSDDTFMGKKAYSNTYLAYSGDTEVKGFIIGCAVGRRLYVLHFCASYEDYAAMEKLMRYMVKSVELVDEDD